MKTILWAKRVAIGSLATLALMSFAVAASPGQTPQVRIDATTAASGVRIEAKATGPFEYTTYRPSESLFVVDLTGVTASTANGAHILKSDAVSSYRVLQYRSGEMGIVRIEVLLRGSTEPKIDRTSADALSIRFEAGAAQNLQPVAAKSTAPVPVARLRSATLIEDVRVNTKDEQTLVTVVGNGKLSYDALRLNNPERLVLDFAGTHAKATQKNYGADNAPVKGVRVGQFKAGVSRVVIDLDRGLPYRLNASDNAVTVSFGATHIASARETVTLAPVEKPVVRVAPERKAEKPAEQPKGDAKTANAAPAANSIASEAASMNLPANLTNSDAALAAPKKVAVEPVSAIPVAAKAESTPNPQQGKFTGEPISVNFKDLDLKDFFRLIHEISGLNVVVDPSVRGNITIVLEDVPWDQALDIALRNNNLDKSIEGNVLRIATRATLKKEAEDRRDLAKAEAEAVDQQTRTFTLSYAKAANMRETLKRFLSSRGEILADDRSNSLIVRDIPAVFPDIINLMTQLDKKTQQVEIEARVVAASRTFARQVGTQFGFATSSTGGRSVYGGLVGASGFASPVQRGAGLPPPPLVSTGGASIPLISNLPATAPNSGFTFSHASPNFALDFILSAAESRGVGKILSKPKIFTQNNKKGIVQQGTKIPLQTVVNNTITVQYIDAVLKMEVTPQITAEGTVFLEVIVENTAIDDGIPRILGIPALTTQRAETSILVADGGTVVMGGVIVSQQRTDIQQVPLLGSIP
ncbi:MAG: type IV pilus secretin PilQ, partial [Acidobacteria bacterium]|nr:type IV pilus secretin PilQ [Acidobacteriota bacterium]